MNPMHRSSSYGLSGASIRLLLTAGLCMLAAVMYAAPGEKEESFDVGQFVFEHIQDAHSWHICKIGGKDIAIPLPVLVYSKQTGWHAFMSSRLREGAEWKGFFIEEEGDEAGKLLERLPDGSTHRPGLDLSITKNVCAIFISIALLLAIFLSMARVCAGRRGKAPKGLQNMMETVILFIRDEVAIPSIGKEKYEAYMPYLLTIFFFILVNNLMGLLPIFPGGANVTGNIAVTLSLALFTFLMTNIKSTKTYWKDIVNTPGAPVWLKLPIHAGRRDHRHLHQTFCAHGPAFRQHYGGAYGHHDLFQPDFRIRHHTCVARFRRRLRVDCLHHFHDIPRITCGLHPSLCVHSAFGRLFRDVSH